MRFMFLIIIVFFSYLDSYSQSIKDQLEGTWICTQITNTNDEPIVDQPTALYGLKFDKSKCSMYNAPFNSSANSFSYVVDGVNRIIKVYLGYGGTYDENGNRVNALVPNLEPTFLYQIKEISKETLIVDLTTNFSGVTRYTLKRKEFIDKELDGKIISIENKYILIKDLSPLSRSAEYWFGSNKIVHNQAVFKGDFGDYLARKVRLGKNFPIDAISSEVIVQFTINESGSPEQIKLIQGLNEKLNTSLIKAIQKTKGKWTPLAVNKKSVKSNVKFHFLFYKNKGSL